MTAGSNSHIDISKVLPAQGVVHECQRICDRYQEDGIIWIPTLEKNLMAKDMVSMVYLCPLMKNLQTRTPLKQVSCP